MLRLFIPFHEIGLLSPDARPDFFFYRIFGAQATFTEKYSYRCIVIDLIIKIFINL